jgi:putative toxin-antitoxin system antitoxin component (TIGR02293 family)
MSKTPAKKRSDSFLTSVDPNGPPLFSMLQIIREGIPVRDLFAFIEATGLPEAAVLRVMGISRRTLERRAQGALSPQQSDRLARIKRIWDLTVHAIGDESRARGWLVDPNRAMKGELPLDLLDTDAGARMVEAVLARIVEGIFA